MTLGGDRFAVEREKNLVMASVGGPTFLLPKGNGCTGMYWVSGELQPRQSVAMWFGGKAGCVVLCLKNLGDPLESTPFREEREETYTSKNLHIELWRVFLL